MRVDQTCVEVTTVTTMYYRQWTCTNGISISEFLPYLDSSTCSILSPKMLIILKGCATIGIWTQIDRTTSHIAWHMGVVQVGTVQHAPAAGFTCTHTVNPWVSVTPLG